MLKSVWGGIIDLLLTDPPYNVALNADRDESRVILNDSWETDVGFVEFLLKTFKAADQVMKPGAAFYIWHASSQAKNFIKAAEAAGWEIKQTLIWVKDRFTLGRQDYQWRHEPCLYGWKDGAAHYFIDDRSQDTVYEDGVDIDHMNKSDMKKLLHDLLDEKVPATVLREAKPAKSSEHPTMKPLRLMARLIANSTLPDQTVLDLFGGSGSTLMACEQLGRKCCTLELDPKFCDVIVSRWENFTGEKAELVNR